MSGKLTAVHILYPDTKSGQKRITIAGAKVPPRLLADDQQAAWQNYIHFPPPFRIQFRKGMLTRSGTVRGEFEFRKAHGFRLTRR